MTTAISRQNAAESLPVEIYPNIAQLPPIRQTILVALLTNIVSKERKTETAIAKELGIDRGTIQRARQNRLFGELLMRLTTDFIAGSSDIIAANLFHLAVNNVKANEILGRIAKLYDPITKTMSQNVNINASTEYTDTNDMISAFLDRCKAMGKTRDDIVALWDAL